MLKKTPPDPKQLEQDIIREAVVDCNTSLHNVTSLSLSVKHCTKYGKAGENVCNITKGHIRQLELCWSCLEKTKSDKLVVHDFSETCYTLKPVCTDCQLAGQLRSCDSCTLESKKCEKRAIFIMTSDCEEGDKQMFLKMKD